MLRSLETGWLTTGPFARQLESEFADYAEAPLALAVSSCTAAMYLALRALGIGEGDGDEVITTPLTWPATANVIVRAGARPVFVDVDDATLCLDPAAVAAAVTPRTRAIMPVHYAGHPCDLAALEAICREHGLRLVEDAAHATETRLADGRKIGSVGDITCFSFYANKNLAAGEGGMLTLADEALAGAHHLAAAARAHARLLEALREEGPGRLRRPRARLQAQPQRSARRRRARSAAPPRGAPRAPGRPGGALRRGPRGPRGHHAARAPARTPRASTAGTSTSVRIARDGRGRRSRRLCGGARRGGDRHRPALPARARPDLLPRGSHPTPSLPVAEAAGAEVLSLPLSPAHSLADVDDVVAAVRRLHAHFTR